MQEFSTVDIERILGIKRKRLLEWIDGVFVKPSISEAKGVGTKNLFSLWDLYGLEMFRRLLETDVPRSQAMVVFSNWSVHTKNLEYEKKTEISKIILSHYLVTLKLGDKEVQGHNTSTQVVYKNQENIDALEMFKKKNKEKGELVRIEVIDVTEIIKFVDKLIR